MSLLDQIRRNAYEAAVDQNYVSASSWIVHALISHGFQPTDCANLAFLAFNHCSRGTRVDIFEKLRSGGISDIPGSAATFLRLSFELDLYGSEAGELVEHAYVDAILAPQIKARLQKPIIFWHIPKCSGTSLNSTLGSHFYHGNVSDVLPGYNYRPLVTYLMKNLLEEIPYFPSMHFGYDDITPRGDFFAFSVLRDPVKRCLSMYRQELASRPPGRTRVAKWHHYRILARYGAFWDYRRDRIFRVWLERIPDWLLKRQLTTFSIRQDIQQAVERIGELDYVFTRDIGRGSEARLFDLLGLEYAPEMVPTHMNRSNKQIELPAEAEDILRERLGEEYELLERIHGTA